MKNTVLTVQKEGFVGVLTVNEAGEAHLRYLNPFQEDQDDDIPEEVTDALYAKAERKVRGHNISKEGKNNPWGFVMY